MLRISSLFLLGLTLGLCCCTSYQPLGDASLRQPVGAKLAGVKVTFLGNSTLYIDDGKTALLVDGFLSRPGMIQTLLGRIGPEPKVIRAELGKAGIDRVDTVLVGHAHHDHALDATAIAEVFGAEVVGSDSFAKIYEGSHDRTKHGSYVPIPKDGKPYKKGRFVVTFVEAAHVGSHSKLQEAVEGEITESLVMPAHYSKFKCGDVYAIHIAHPEGEIAVTTTAGAVKGKLDGMRADVFFLGVGTLSRECPCQQEEYWQETIGATRPAVVVPVHWDDFSRKLSRGLKATRLTGDPKTIMDIVKRKATKSQIRVLDLRESLWIHNRKVFCP